MFIFKFLFYFSVSFLLLSVRIDKHSVFYHLDNYSRPYTLKVWGELESKAHYLIESGSAIARKLFQNTVPRENDISDNVKRQFSANAVDIKTEDYSELYPEDYTDEEKEILKNMLQ